MGAAEVYEAASVAEARARAHASGPCDLCILDLGLPDGNGLDLLGELRNSGWPRLVVLSAADDPYSVRAAFVAGAQGYLLKSASPSVVSDGVRTHFHYSIGYYLSFFLAGLLVCDFYVNRGEWRVSLLWDLVALTLWPLVWILGRNVGHVLLPFTIVGLYLATFRGRMCSAVFSNSVITSIGGMCYSIYLFHFLVIYPVKTTWFNLFTLGRTSGSISYFKFV